MSWENTVHDGAPYDADDVTITHHILDRKQVPNGDTMSRSGTCNIHLLA